jgi:fatty acid desaturase
LSASPVLEQTIAAERKADYSELKRIIREQGLFESQPGYYRMKAIVACVTLGVGLIIAVLISSPLVLLLDAAFLGFATTQIGLLAHDAGHRQGFRGRRTNALARYLLGDLLLGVSQSWWKVKHTRHHASPNHIDDDPDIQIPMVVFSVEQIPQRPRWLRPAIAFQAFVFPLLLPLQALNMRVNSVQHLFSSNARKPWLEGAILAVHAGLYALLLIWIGDWRLALGFFLIHQATFGFYNSSVFAANHKGMPLTDNGRRWGFLHEQVLTSRNVRSNPFIDFWYGGLNFQIEHHLFPTLPRNRLRQAQAVVEQFCAERGISYYATGLFQSYGEILAHLHRVSAPLRQRNRVAA